MMPLTRLLDQKSKKAGKKSKKNSRLDKILKKPQKSSENFYKVPQG